MPDKTPKNAKSPLKNAADADKKPVENSDEKLASSFRKADRSAVKHSGKKSRANAVMLGLGVVGILGGVGCALAGVLMPREMLPDLTFPVVPSAVETDNNIYSKLTGLKSTAEAVNGPAYCIQTPNGTDGARPQVGLNQAGVVFEAIAEAGITRFAAIYQNPTSAVIGPIRSLRIYYLEWDTPFDCTIVHAGGAEDALAAVSRGGYRDLTENYTYMYRGSNAARRWNNLFTTSGLLAQMANDRGYDKSDVKGFSRLTPEEAARARVDAGAEPLVITAPASGDTSAVKAAVANVAVNFGGLANFNVRYTYDAERNVYARGFESGAAHEIYVCPEENLGEVNPEGTCSLEQLAPSVVVAMEVAEKRAADGYHEDITTVGSGKAWVFQNGQAIVGSWSKSSVKDQIKFFDASGAEIKLVPGQTFVEAVPGYGSVEYN